MRCWRRGRRLRVTGDGGSRAGPRLLPRRPRRSRRGRSRRSTINIIEDQHELAGAATRRRRRRPARTRRQRGRTQRVVWTGTVTPDARRRCTSSGSIRRAMSRCSSTASEVLDRWRQNWNPWYHNFDLELDRRQAGRHARRVGAERRLHRAAAQRSAARRRPPFADAVVRGRPRRSTITSSAGDRHGRGHRRLSHADRQGADDAELGLRLLAEPPALRDPGRSCSASLREYRKRGLPLDNIVQDWFYWPEDQLGLPLLRPDALPRSARRWSTRSTRSNAHFMISVWAKFYPTHRQLQGARRGRRDLSPHGRPAARRADRRRLHQGHVPRLGRPGLCQRLLRSLQSPRRATSTGGRSRDALGEQGLRRLVAGFRRARLPFEPVDRGARSGAWARPRAGRARPIFNSYPLVHVDGVYRRPASRTSPTCGRSSSPAPASAASSAPAPRSGRATSPRAGTICATRSRPGVNFSMSGVPNWTPRHRRLRASRSAITEAGRRRTSPNGASSTCAGSSSAPSRPLFRSHGEFPYREIYEIVAGRARRRYRSMAWYDRLRYRLMPYIYTLARRHLLQRRHDHARAGDGLRRRPEGAGTSTTNICSARRSSSRRSPSSRRASARSICRRARRWYDFYTGRSIARRADDHGRRALRAHAAVRPRRLDRADRPGDPVHRRRAACGRSRCTSTPAPTAASRSTRTTASAANI